MQECQNFDFTRKYAIKSRKPRTKTPCKQVHNYAGWPIK